MKNWRVYAAIAVLLTLAAWAIWSYQADGILRVLLVPPADGSSTLDALRVSLPVGTVSGAPKIRAMQIIDEVEPTRRGPYGGAVGYLDFAGNMDTCIALRTIVWRNGTFDVQAGAGVVADSDAKDEELECHNKAKALLAAVPAARRMTAKRSES